MQVTPSHTEATRQIELQDGFLTLVDGADFESVSHLSWYAHECRPGYRYARRNVRIAGKWTTVPLHREIMGADPGEQVDHINGDTLDNRRCNLRLCTCSENMQNQRPQVGRSSRHKGVTWSKRGAKWYAVVGTGARRQRYIGCFDDEDAAGRAYDRAALQQFGEFARLNFPLEV